MRLTRLLALLFCLVASAAGAQGFVNPSPWNSVRGEAVALSIAPDGFIIAAGRDARLWNWRAADAAWTPLAGEGIRVAALSGGRYFALRRDGELTYFDGLHINAVELRALDVAIDRNGFPYAIRSDGALVRRLSAASPWEVLAVLNGRRVAVASDNSAWVALADGSLARWFEGRLENMSGSAREIAAGSDGTLLAIDRDGIMQRWNAFNRSWSPEPAPPDVAAIALGPQNVPWSAASSGAVYTRAPLEHKGPYFALAPGEGSITFGKRTVRGGLANTARVLRASSYAALNPPTQTTDTAPFVWIDTFASADKLAIAGRDGSVFALDDGGNIARWSNLQRKFTSYPGQFAKIAVEADGNLWGVNSLGRVFRRDANLWHQIIGTASDLSIGLKGEIFATTSTGGLFRYDAASDSLQQQQGTLFAVAVAPDGVPWGLLNDGSVVRCPTPVCQRLQRTARSIAIGPDGSVFIVTLDGVLQQLRKSLDDWDVIPVLGLKVRNVAVGPRGRPWVVAESGRVYATTFFPRDESTDLLEASTTSTITTGSGSTAPVADTVSAGGFTFSKNLLFDSIAVPGGATGLSLGPDGTVIMFVGLTGLIRYDNSKKAFVTITGYPSGNIRHAKYGPDGTLWIISSDVDGRIYHQLSGSSYETIQLPIPNPQPPVAAAMNQSINIGPDGSVYAIDTVGTLWRRPAGSTTFSKLISGTYSNAAIPRANDVWVIDSNSIVREIVNSVAQRRPLNLSMQATDIAGARDGSVYIISDYNGTTYPAKWNANSQAWDRVNTRAHNVGVAPDGRPWLWDDNNPNVILRAK
jgi:hypothetical protein